MVHGSRLMAYLWCMVNGYLWFMVHGSGHTYGSWLMVHGSLIMVHGSWLMVHGYLWRLEMGLHIIE